jgi:hypothetical protein
MARKKDFLLLSKSGKSRRINKYLKPAMNLIETKDEGILGFIESLLKCIFIIAVFCIFVYLVIESLFFD